MKLESIRLIQFFLYEQETVRLGNISAIFGPNGSGKSTLLDAVQIALFGANVRSCALNAQADDTKKTTRSIREYCLGQYGEGPQQRARESATTYITLVWRNSETGEPLSMGVCLHASGDKEGHEVLGRYILPGVELALREHIEIVDGEDRPMEWTTFRKMAAEKSKVSGETPFYHDSERYVSAALLALRGTGSVPNYEAFVRAFRFALRMRFNKSVDEIVRHEILETRPTNIRKFKEVTESFRHLSEMVADVEKRVADGEAIDAEFTKADRADQEAVTWQALAADADHEAATDAHVAARHATDDAEEAFADASRKLEATTADAKNAAVQVTSFQHLREHHKSHADLGALQASLEEKRTTATNKAGEMKNLASLMRRQLAQAAQSPFLAKRLPDLAEEAALLDDLPLAIGALSRDELRAAMQRPLEAINAAVNALVEVSGEIKERICGVEDEIADVEGALARVGAGKIPLSENVQRLLTEFNHQGLDPVPVCDVVSITQTEWQPVIESYLGTNLQALIVPPHQESKAFQIYRSLRDGRAVYGAKIAMESRYASPKAAPKATVAELIEGTHPAAVAYLQSCLGSLMRAESDSEALGGQRTLTCDGMLLSNGAFERLRLIPSYQLRIGADTQDHRSKLVDQQRELNQRKLSLKTDAAAVSSLLNDLRKVGEPSTAMNYLLGLHGEMEVALQAVAMFAKKLEDSADQDYIDLGIQLAAWKVDEKNLQAEQIRLHGEKVKAEVLRGNCQSEEINAYDALQAAKTRLNAAKLVSGFDNEFATHQWAVMLRDANRTHESMKAHCAEKYRFANARRETATNAGTGLVSAYRIHHREDMPVEALEDWRTQWQWIQGITTRLRDTQLHEYREQMQEAYLASQETFRNDVAMTLNGYLEDLGTTMTRLNNALKACPVFTNGERYQFRRVVKPALKPLLDFIVDVAAHGPSGDLFGGPGELPPQFKEILDDKIATGSAGINSPLDDYREFFEFDIEIQREDAITKQLHSFGHLSKRIGQGSGGEHRAPLYVIAGAALASAYRMESPDHNGARFIMLDEAFNKMDITNIVSTMRYLEDLGFQILLSSPGENEGVLMAFLDRHYNIMSDPDLHVIALEGHDISKEINETFRFDLPEFNPILIAAEISRMRQPVPSA